MIYLELVNNPEPIEPSRGKHEINFLGTIIKEIIENNVYPNEGKTIDRPFNLDSLLLWPTNIQEIFVVTHNSELLIEFEDTDQLKSVKLLSGYIKKLSPSTPAWTSKADWTRYFHWAPVISDGITIPEPNMLKFNLSHLIQSEQQELCNTTDDFPEPKIYFSFGFKFSFKIEGDNQTYYGKVDPLVKISSQG